MDGTGVADFKDGDWASLLEELSLLVASSGFGAWDDAMVASLAEEGEPISARVALVAYLDEFIQFLEIRSSERLERDRERLMKLVALEDGAPAADAVLVFVPRYESEASSDEAGRAVSILSSEPSDGIVKELRRFRNAMLGDEPHYFDDADDLRGES